MIKYVFLNSGILSIPLQTLSLFVRSTFLSEDGNGLTTKPVSNHSTEIKMTAGLNPIDLIPDIELMPLPINAMDLTLEENLALYPKIGLFTILATLLQAKSRGTVRLASPNPLDRPVVDFNYLSDPSDITLARKAIRLSLKLGETMKAAGFPLLSNLSYPEELHKLDIENGNTVEMDKFIRQQTRSTFHYSCSCRMAPGDDEVSPGVVDDELRVYGVQNLRVCDTSVFPEIISSHTQAPAVMVAERCADFIKTRA